uniref:Ovule protein n=1 Tax=Echinococcus granulosus TaxID=6210 RepID=A0A068X467_ECHGR|nr:hypothetical protein EgrG_000578200 [Echinococcus granulosus]
MKNAKALHWNITSELCIQVIARGKSFIISTAASGSCSFFSSFGSASTSASTINTIVSSRAIESSTVEYEVTVVADDVGTEPNLIEESDKCYHSTCSCISSH